MRIRAVIFDVYHTLLEIGPPPLDAAERWEFLWEDTLADPARLSAMRAAARSAANADAAGRLAQEFVALAEQAGSDARP